MGKPSNCNEARDAERRAYEYSDVDVFMPSTNALASKVRFMLDHGRVMDEQKLLAVLRERVVRHSDEIPPPYLFPDAVDEPFPGMPATTIGETLHGVWQSAHEQIVEIIDDLNQLLTDSAATARTLRTWHKQQERP